jgi:uncharacterized protein YndB with AHSA1/START domain
MVLQRVYPSTVERMWDLWTTVPGLESWWGPEGFTSKVRKLDVRPGGTFEIEVTATEPERADALRATGLPLTNLAQGTYTEVVPPRRIAYKTLVDFPPGVPPYEVVTEIEFQSEGKGVRMIVTQDALHDPRLTRMSAVGLDQQFNKLGALLFALSAAGRRED